METRGRKAGNYCEDLDMLDCVELPRAWKVPVPVVVGQHSCVPVTTYTLEAQLDDRGARRS